MRPAGGPLVWILIRAVLALVVAAPLGATVVAVPAIAVQQGANSAYDAVAYVYDAPALLSSQSESTTYVWGSPSGPEAASWGRSASTRGCCVAAETAPARFVASRQGILDTEAPALRQQIGDVVDSMRSTGAPPPGVRQGGLPGKPGVYGNRSGDLPVQPEGYYHETDVWPGPGSRGTERLVVGGPGEVWYSPGHYGTFRSWPW